MMRASGYETTASAAQTRMDHGPACRAAMEGSTIRLCPRTALVYRTNPSVRDRCLRSVAFVAVTVAIGRIHSSDRETSDSWQELRGDMIEKNMPYVNGIPKANMAVEAQREGRMLL